ncbi:hypothetical protein MKX01_025864 [Papaver californicum]|nr:hypothetical protein MKX01_025864 [Papaver californicum]
MPERSRLSNIGALMLDHPRQITVPIKKGRSPMHILDIDNGKTISQLLLFKWDPSCQHLDEIPKEGNKTNQTYVIPNRKI